MRTTVLTISLLVLSNVFMTLAWYWHLKNSLATRAWYLAALASWGIALFEYLLQVPANRIGHERFSLPQLKIMQEVIALGVFAVVSIVVFKSPVKRDYLWASLCMVGAAYFMFRK